jgi:hypothetical protein
MEGETELRRRIVLIDNAPPATTITTSALVSDLTHVIRVMEQITSVWWQTKASEPPIIEPKTSDNITGSSKTIKRITKAAPEFVTGPLVQGAQAWTGAGGESYFNQYRPRQVELAERFFKPLPLAKTRLKTKPRDGGLFTSTLVPGSTTTMWLMYQEPFGDHNPLFPKPWRTYQTTTSKKARIYEANCAKSYANLVEQYALEDEGLLYPNWEDISRDYDAVHVTISTIIAIQGLRLATTKGIIADAYWDVEQTLWLKWRFKSMRLLRED